VSSKTAPEWRETDVTWIADGVRLEGKILFDRVTRVQGLLKGDVRSAQGSTLILCDRSQTEAEIHGDHVIIDGYVKGNVSATSKIEVSHSGRVIGNLSSPVVSIAVGAFFDGKVSMSAASATSSN